MALLVLAYPELSKQDYETIQDFRRQHDELYYQVIALHFTLVFPIFAGWEVDAFVSEVEKQVKGLPPFDFCLRAAAFNKDSFNAHYHAFLVPDEGFGRLLKLHDQLYADQLFPNRALHIDFIPHIGVGNSTDPQQCLRMVEHWNQSDFAIHGRITMLDVVSYENDTIQAVRKISLEK